MLPKVVLDQGKLGDCELCLFKGSELSRKEQLIVLLNSIHLPNNHWDNDRFGFGFKLRYPTYKMQFCMCGRGLAALNDSYCQIQSAPQTLYKVAVYPSVLTVSLQLEFTLCMKCVVKRMPRLVPFIPIKQPLKRMGLFTNVTSLH